MKLYFATSNKGKIESLRRLLENIVDVEQYKFDFIEDLDDVQAIAEKKARDAFDVLNKPVIVDDSGFVIDKYGNYPNHRVHRILQEKGIAHFLDMAHNAENKELNAYFVMIKAYMKEGLDKPIVFISKAHGKLIDEMRGDLSKPFVKSQIAGCFRLNDFNKCVAELNDLEYSKLLENEWGPIKTFFEKESKDFA